MTLATADKMAVLGRSALLGSVPQPEAELLATMMVEERFGTGETVLVAGEPADVVYVVAEGLLEVRVPGGAVQSLGPGEVVGEYGLFGDHVRSADVVAVEEAVLLAVENERFLALLRTHPDVLLAMFKVTVSRLLDCMQRLRERAP